MELEKTIEKLRISRRVLMAIVEKLEKDRIVLTEKLQKDNIRLKTVNSRYARQLLEKNNHIYLLKNNNFSK